MKKVERTEPAGLGQDERRKGGGGGRVKVAKARIRK